MPTTFAEQYFDRALERLVQVRHTQMRAIQNVATLMAEAIASGGIVHVFGAGHSHLLAEEIFYRAGGLAPINAILEPSLMLHAGAMKSSLLEKVPEYASALFEHHDIQHHDVLIVISNSGVNAVSVELAVQAKDRGVKTVGLTCRAYSERLIPQNPSKKRLYEVADVVIDNGGEFGDAVMELPGVEQKVGPLSTVTGAIILNAIVTETVERLKQKGNEPPIFLSSHIPQATEHNAELVKRYRVRVRSL